MQFIGSIAIIILLLQYDTIRSAPTETTSPGEQDNSESQLIDSSMIHGFQQHHKKSIDYYEYRRVVADGVQKALDECRQRFKWDRWNCPKKAFLSILDREEFSEGQEPLPSNKELGLARAYIASSIVLVMINTCSKGTNSMCACTNPTSELVQTGELLPADHHTNGSPTSSLSDLEQHHSHHSDVITSLQLGSVNSAQSIDQKPRHLDQVQDSLVSGNVSPTHGMNQPEALNQKNSKFAWAGCDEIVKFGFKVAKMYLDSQDKLQGDPSRLINAHNYEVGRLAVKKLMKRKCKCHGPSATCQVKTCWIVVPDISEVGDYLKRQYRVAAKVGAITAKETDTTELVRELSAISPDKLVFADASPDYCYENKQLGVNGTLGRYCSRSKHRADGTEVSRSERDSCDRLCTKCGYKIKRERINVEKQCDCRFVYCCSVECKRCPHVEDTYKCVRHS